jgi:hypothetical protein
MLAVQISFHWLDVSFFCCSKSSIMTCSSAGWPGDHTPNASLATPKVAFVELLCWTIFLGRSLAATAQTLGAQPTSSPVQLRWRLPAHPLSRPQSQAAVEHYVGVIESATRKTAGRTAGRHSTAEGRLSHRVQPTVSAGSKEPEGSSPCENAESRGHCYSRRPCT